jgi:hypothetical protein
VARVQRTGTPAGQDGFVWSARAAAFARCDLGGDHAPGDCLAAWQLPGPRRDPDHAAEPAAADVPAACADVGSCELVAAEVRTLTTTAWAHVTLDDHRDGEDVVRRAVMSFKQRILGTVQVTSKMTSCLRRLGEIEPYSQSHRVFSCVTD